MIGLTTPPLGICLFVASVIAKISVERIVKAIWPFILASIVVLVLVTFFPFLSLWIPNLVIR
ncbi:MAG: TRAP transporter large permease subunit [Candidatus Hodarchaeota archaeon]